MKKAIYTTIIWIIFFSIFCLFTNYVYGAPPPDFCVRVFTYEGGEDLSMGSGVLIAEDIVITNWHVVQDRRNDNSIKILFTDWKIVRGEVIKIHKKWDLALIKIPKQTKREIVIAGIPAKRGHVLCIHGYGHGLPGFSYGLAARTDDVITIKGAVPRYGDSGGCILNYKDELVGVLYGYRGNYTYGSPIDIIITFVNGEKKCH